jgi:hypothetical protein
MADPIPDAGPVDALKAIRDDVERMKGWCLATIEAKLDPVEKKGPALVGRIEEIEKALDRVVTLGANLEHAMDHVGKRLEHLEQRVTYGEPPIGTT